jgi:hypothetical protein
MECPFFSPSLAPGSSNLSKFMISCAANAVVRVAFANICRILARIRAGAQQAVHATNPFGGDARRMDVAGRSLGATPLVVDTPRDFGSLRPGVDFALYTGAQQARYLRAPALVLVGRPAHGALDDHRPHGSGSAKVRDRQAAPLIGTDSRWKPWLEPGSTVVTGRAKDATPKNNSSA